MLKKKLISLGIATVFALSSLTTSVFAADLKVTNTNANVTVKYSPGKGNGNNNGNKNGWKKFDFSDLTDVSWALNAIEKVSAKGILNGIGQGKFAPRGNVTQLEAIASVLKLTGDNDLAMTYNSKMHPLYKGIKPMWGLGYIYLAIEKKILLPEELFSFNPNTPVKRHEMAKYILRAMGKTDEALKYMDEDLTFNDSDAVPKNSVGYVYLIDKLGIMTGNNNTFRPMASLSRAELAIILDRADGSAALPDTSTRKNNTVFVSFDKNDDEITVQKDNKTYTYDVVEGVSVYKDNSFKTIDNLVKGDVLELIFNEDDEVIFIDVIKNASDVEDEETAVSFTAVSYSSLPEVIKDKVDDLKAEENYKAYEYNDYIYLFASMGKKSTGGYDIDIKNVTKTEDDGEYTITAVVYEDTPSTNETVTQVVSYPYDIIKFKSFDNIENVLFVDKDNKKLEDAEIANVDEASIVEGEIYDIISSSKTIKVEKANGSKVSYTIPSSAEIVVNGDDDAIFSDLEEGMKVKLEISDEKVTKVTANNYEDEDVTFENVKSSDLPEIVKEQVDYLKLSKNYKAYEYDNYVYLIATMGKKSTEGYEIDITDVYKAEDNDGNYSIKAVVETDSPSSTSDAANETTYPYIVARFKHFDNIESIKFVDEDNDKLAEVNLVDLDEAVTVEGTIYSINTTSKVLKVEKSNGSVVSFTIPSSAEIIVNGDEESFSDLVKNMKVKVEITDEKVSKVTADDNLTEVEGILTGISIGTSDKKITVKVGSSYKTYTVPSEVKVIIDDNESSLEKLTVNSEITLKFSNGLLIEIEK